MIASAKEIDALNITLFNSFINCTNVHLCNYCTKIFVIVVNTCVCRRSVDNRALILSYPILSEVDHGLESLPVLADFITKVAPGREPGNEVGSIFRHRIRQSLTTSLI